VCWKQGQVIRDSLACSWLDLIWPHPYRSIVLASDLLTGDNAILIFCHPPTHHRAHTCSKLRLQAIMLKCIFYVACRGSVTSEKKLTRRLATPLVLQSTQEDPLHPCWSTASLGNPWDPSLLHAWWTFVGEVLHPQSIFIPTITVDVRKACHNPGHTLFLKTVSQTYFMLDIEYLCGMVYAVGSL